MGQTYWTFFCICVKQCWLKFLTRPQVPDIPSMLAHLRLMPEIEVRRKLAEMQRHRWRFVFKASLSITACHVHHVD